MKTFDIIAKTLFGFEGLLAKELRALGATDILELTRAVIYKGDKALLYKSNLYLRTAIKVLKPITSFEASNEEALYQKVQSIDWGLYLTPEQTFAIDSVVRGEVFTHSQFVALKTKDAIVDQFRDKYGKRPSVELEDPDLRINIHISDKTCSIALDSSGSSLGKRGYKKEQTFAPLSEVLAAGMIMQTEWDGQREFIDPMAGSGTIPIEAALIAGNIAPGSYRSFTFEKWNDFDEELWESIKKEAEESRKPITAKIKGYDIDRKATRIQWENAKRAGVEEYISFETKDLFDLSPDTDDALLLFNPPYGDRLEEKDAIVPMYKEIGDHLKQNFNGCVAWIISGNLQAIKFIGLKPSKKIKIFNGPIECRLHKFELYSGSKKASKQDETYSTQEEKKLPDIIKRFKRR